MNEYNIWITYHKDEHLVDYDLHEDEKHRLFASHHDVEEKNINHLNPVLSEMVTMWYVWKNNKKSKYVGFNHYRRQFDVSRLPKTGECQIFNAKNFGNQTIYQQYAQWHNVNDMKKMMSIVDEKYGRNNPYTNHIMYGRQLISNCCFLMKWSDFTKLCQFLFPLLDEFSERVGCKTVEDWHEKATKDFNNVKPEYQRRTLSFLSERLISAWITTHLSPYIAGRNVAIVNYNTPALVEAAIKSLNKHTVGCHVYVFDNSDKKPFVSKMPNVEVIDNTKGQLIDFDKELEAYPDKWERDIKKSNYGSAKHSMSVDKLMEIIPEGFVLMDSDVLVQEDVKVFWNKAAACVGSENQKHNVPLLMPFFCYLNVPVLKENGIRFFNGEKMWALSNVDPNQYYDTGAWLLEEVRRNDLPVEYVNIWNYVKHLGHGSWIDGNADCWLEENSKLWK